MISEYLIPHPSIRLVTFTGSIPVGKRLAALAGQHMKPAIMELGGHAPVIVCDDVDPEAAAAAAVLGKSRNAGQVCVSPTRWFVAERIHAPFAKAFAEKAAALKIGNGLDPANQMGPLANSRRIEAMTELVADAKAKGAKVLSGGARLANRGYYFPLTVLSDLPDDARAMREEPFGPLALVNPVKNLDEAIAKANSLPYGLAAYAFTNSARNVDRLSRGDRGRQPVDQPLRRLARRDAVRRRQGQRLRPRRRRRGPAGLHGGEERLAPDEVRVHQAKPVLHHLRGSIGAIRLRLLRPTEIPLGLRPHLRLVQRPPQRVEHGVDLGAVDDQRRAQGDAVAADRPADQALLLGEARRLGADAELRVEALLGPLVAHQLQRADQADAARLADQRVIGQRLQPQLEDRRHPLHVRDDVDALVDLDGLERHRAGERMAGIGEAVRQHAVLAARLHQRARTSPPTP